jgi:hypothetical protein
VNDQSEVIARLRERVAALEAQMESARIALRLAGGETSEKKVSTQFWVAAIAGWLVALAELIHKGL